VRDKSREGTSPLRTVVFLISAVIQLTAAAFAFFVLLVGLNGYSERQAIPSLIFYVIFSLASVLVMSAIGCMAAKTFFDRKRLGKVGASVFAVVSSSIVGVVIVVAGMFAAFVLAEVLRRI
jgi:hypothetical protein